MENKPLYPPITKSSAAASISPIVLQQDLRHLRHPQHHRQSASGGAPWCLIVIIGSSPSTPWSFRQICWNTTASARPSKPSSS